MFDKLRRIFLSALLLCLPMLAEATEQQPGQASLEPSTLQFKWLHQFQFAGYYAAKEKGFFAAEGLDVSLQQRSPGIGVIDEVVSGRSEYGVGGMGILTRYANGDPVKALAAICQHDALVFISKAGSGIFSHYRLRPS